MGAGGSISRTPSTANVTSSSRRESRTVDSSTNHAPEKNLDSEARTEEKSEKRSKREDENQQKEMKEGETQNSHADSGKEVKNQESTSNQPANEPNSPKQETERMNSLQTRDVMISYSHADSKFMLKVKEGLEAAGISVWVDVTGLKAGVDFLNKIGQAIIDSRMFVQLLSESCVHSKYCQDELALAYISNKPIFPVGMQPPSDLFPIMDTGVKLQLARFPWNLFTVPEEFDENLKTLVEKLHEFKTSGKVESTLEEKKGKMERGNSRHQVNKHLKSRTSFSKKMSSLSNAMEQKDDEDFWKKNFKKQQSVSWSKFVDTFEKEYKESLAVIFSKSDQEWLHRIIRNELGAEEDGNEVTQENYLDFCTVDEEKLSFWQRVQDQAIESYTMKEVFDMNSSVRVEAIENLGKFRSKAVIEALMDLLKDKDNNIRAVAAISLARTGEKGPKVINQLIRCLGDSDRLVREGACLALGHLKVEVAVPKILHLWRNDFISSVREAAQVALEQIGGNEANKAMYITKVLSEEIRTLTKE